MNVSYKDIILEARRIKNTTESNMLTSINNVSKLLDYVEENNPDLYYKFIREEQGNLFGNHYSEPFALYDVSKMHHQNKGNDETVGEFFSMSQASKIASSNGIKNVADVYVAINANYHDKKELFKKWFQSEDELEENIISDAIHFYFMDEDAPEGKIWLYMNAMK